MICFTYLELDESIVALQQVNETVVQLVTLTDRLQMELDNITAQTVALNSSCATAATTNPNLTLVCSTIVVTPYMVVINYTDVSVLCVYMHACDKKLCMCVCVCVRACMHGYVCDTINHTQNCVLKTCHV